MTDLSVDQLTALKAHLQIAAPSIGDCIGDSDRIDAEEIGFGGCGALKYLSLGGGPC